MIIKHKITGEVLFDGDVANLRGANLQNAYLRDANLQSANLQNANLTGAYLRDANLTGAYLRDANLQSANLQNAYLRGANLQGANLQNAYLRGANLQGANLTGAKYETQIILKYFTITRLGTRLDNLQVFILETKVICKTGCFTGSPEELSQELNLEKIEHLEYKIALEQIEAMRKLYQK